MTDNWETHYRVITWTHDDRRVVGGDFYEHKDLAEEQARAAVQYGNQKMAAVQTLRVYVAIEQGPIT